MNFRRWVVFTLLVHVLVVAIDKGGGLILYLLCANRPDQHGIAGLVSTTPFVLMAIANLGLASSQVYLLRKGRFSPQQTFSTNLTVAVVWGGFVALLAGLVMAYVLPALRPAWQLPTSVILSLCALVPMLLVASYANTIQLATERVKDYALVHLVTSVVYLPAFLGCFFWLGGDASKGDASVASAWGRTISTALVLILALWMIRNIVRIRFGIDREYLRAGLRYGWQANLTSTLNYLNHRLDLYVVGALAVGASDSSAQVGFYSISVTWAELVWHFPEALRDLFFNKVAGSTHEKARELTPVLTRLSLAASLVAGIGVVLLVDPVMGTLTLWAKGSRAVWDQQWSPTVRACLWWLTPGTVAYTIAKVLQADLAGRNRQRACIIAQVLVLVIMLTLDCVWIPQYGAVGAAAASTIAYAASSIYALAVYTKETRTSVWQCLLPRRVDLVYFRDIVTSVMHKIRGVRA
jgi:O-antigen/teichoic acid export membrane protein